VTLERQLQGEASSHIIGSTGESPVSQQQEGVIVIDYAEVM
jgi:hypothetical protein